jgi:hypothetical protein
VRTPLAAALVLALCLVACGSLLPNGDRVELLTGPPGDWRGCFTSGATGLLMVDPKYGTAIIDTIVQSTSPETVAWPRGFTARRIGSEVEVFDAGGNAVAKTGKSYELEGGYVSAGGSSGLTWPELPIHVFWSCGSVTPGP